MSYKPLYHIPLFLFGFLYYLVLPPCVVSMQLFATFPGMSFLYQYFSPHFIPTYAIIITIFCISFIIGAILPFKYMRKKNIASDIHYISNKDLFLFASPFWVAGQYMIITNRQNLFQGYQIDYDTELIGAIATINTIFLFFFLYSRNIPKNKQSKWSNFFITFSIFEFSSILLGFGSRMYIMIPLIAYIIYLLDQKKIKLRKLFLQISIAIIFLLGIGIWRLGDSDYTIDAIMYIGVAEPTLTWISAESMFDKGDLPYIAFPSNFLTSFINFVPSFLLPDKAALIQPINISYDSPFGATNILVSLISNFGILGSCTALFLLGFILTSIRINGKTAFAKTYYYCVCGMIPFQLFRDNIAIVNKMLFYNFLIVPLIIFCIEKFISNKYPKHNEYSI